MNDDEDMGMLYLTFTENLDTMVIHIVDDDVILHSVTLPANTARALAQAINDGLDGPRPEPTSHLRLVS